MIDRGITKKKTAAVIETNVITLLMKSP